MAAAGNIKVRVVDYRSVNLAWLIRFKDQLLSKELAPEVDLVQALEDSGGENGSLKVREGDTLCVKESNDTTYTVTKPYSDVGEGKVARSSVRAKTRAQWTTEDVAEYVVKRACDKAQCTYLELLNSASEVSKREYQGAFVSQARKCLFVDLVGALQYFFELKKADLSKQFVWLDLFSANQPKLTARNVEPSVRKENEQQLTQGLHLAIASYDQRVLFLDKWDGALALTRAWCVWEIFGVDKAKKQLEIALPEREFDRFIATLKHDYDSILTTTSSIDVEKANCFSKEDLATIQREIRDKSSFRALNEIVKTQLRLWVANTGKLQVEKEEQKESPDLSELSLLANQVAMTYQDQGDLESSEQLLRKALKLAIGISADKTNDKTVAARMNNLALVLKAQGKLDDARKLYEEAIAIWKAVYGAEHRKVATGLNNLALVLRSQGLKEEAREMWEEALAIWKKVLSADDPQLAFGLNNLAGLLKSQGKYEEARPLFEEAIAIFRNAKGDYSPKVAIILNNLAQLLKAQGKYDEAIPMSKESLEIRRNAYGNDHLTVATALNNLGELYQAMGNYDKARAMHEEALAVRRKAHGDKHQDVAQSLNNLALVLEMQHQKEEASKLGKDALRIALIVFGLEHPITQRYKQKWEDKQ